MKSIKYKTFNSRYKKVRTGLNFYSSMQAREWCQNDAVNYSTDWMTMTFY